MPPFTSQYGGANFNLGNSSTSNFTNPNSTGGSNASPNINLSGNGSSYSEQYGQSNFTLSEARDKENKGTKSADAADIIGVGAGGLDSIANFIATVTGKGGSNTNNNYTAPPPSEKKTSPLLIGGIASGVVVLIIVLILTRNGQAKQ
jgi:hypothetical protein